MGQAQNQLLYGGCCGQDPHSEAIHRGQYPHPTLDASDLYFGERSANEKPRAPMVAAQMPMPRLDLTDRPMTSSGLGAGVSCRCVPAVTEGACTASSMLEVNELSYAPQGELEATSYQSARFDECMTTLDPQRAHTRYQLDQMLLLPSANPRVQYGVGSGNPEAPVPQTPQTILQRLGQKQVPQSATTSIGAQQQLPQHDMLQTPQSYRRSRSWTPSQVVGLSSEERATLVRIRGDKTTVERILSHTSDDDITTVLSDVRKDQGLAHQEVLRATESSCSRDSNSSHGQMNADGLQSDPSFLTANWVRPVSLLILDDGPSRWVSARCHVDRAQSVVLVVPCNPDIHPRSVNVEDNLVITTPRRGAVVLEREARRHLGDSWADEMQELMMEEEVARATILQAAEGSEGREGNNCRCICVLEDSEVQRDRLVRNLRSLQQERLPSRGAGGVL